MALVNDGLSEAEFNTGTHLQIEVTERQLPDVLLFREQVREVLEHAYRVALDAADTEARFAVLSGIVKRLSGEDPDDKRCYAPVILVEAFGKAETEFTELAMRIFERFGFQMIVATPLKSVMTLEPFIGGACFVAIEDRKRSNTLRITYDRERRRLALPEQIAQQEPDLHDVRHDGRHDGHVATP